MGPLPDVASGSWSSYKGRTVDALAPGADEGRSKLRKAPVSRKQALSAGDIRMGQPGGRHGPPPAPEHIRCVEGTRGTETSQYPEEEKEVSIPRVAASERGRAQTPRVQKPAGVACGGLQEARRQLQLPAGKSRSSRSWLESRAAEGESPVGERVGEARCSS
jgi:hypothetical protein